ncbi:MAG: lipid-binding SYLF domain-containing protein [Planctomycetota bacterium]|nr:lipid-binding SYLF domain-containing protein [Planctomycetota bacterium]
MHSHSFRIPSIVVSLLVMILTGCNTAPATISERASLRAAVASTVNRMQSEDESVKPFFDNAYGYAVFPDVGTGAFIVGGAYGRGVVFKSGSCVGYADMTQGSIGFQIGGASYDEVIFFSNQATYEKFVAGQFTPTAGASAVALSAGAAAAAGYSDGVVIFVSDSRGLMASAAIGGQKFKFEAESNLPK